ncbi:MAG: hypothetical protein P8X70_00445 [Nanoarchaeota archaeon]
MQKKENKSKGICKKKRFCNIKENNLASTGKGIVSLVFPTAGIGITAYETGKSLIKFGICKKR